MKNKFIILLLMICLFLIIGCNDNNDNDVNEPVTYTVTFDSDGGSVVSNQTVKENEKVVKPENPTKEGYTFLGWFIGEDEFNFDTLVTSNTNLLALWQENKKPIEEIELKYTEVDLANIFITINDKDVTVDLSNNSYLKTLLLSINLYKNNEYIDNGERTSKYVLIFTGYEFTIYDNNSICYIDSENEIDYVFCTDNKLDYLDTLFGSVVLDFNNYTEEQIIRVFNSECDLVEIEEKDQFLNELKKIKYFKLMYPDHYELGDLIYQIQIDEELINIYSDYIMIDENLYKCIDGDFYFLNDLKFSFSSGWLPWV